VCGSFDKGRCTAVPDRSCAPGGCPYLEGERPSLPAGRRPDALDRRTVVLGGIAAAGAATIGAVAAAAAAGGGRLVGAVKVRGGAKALSGNGGGTSAHGTKIGPAKDVPVGQSALFTVPSNSAGAPPGDPGLVIQDAPGTFVAYDAVCPHAGCTVGYSASNNVIACPCHGSLFQVSDGALLQGPAPHGLTALTVAESGGQLYVK
jgi:thiosulfate dehydrogenase [quinone] large subunit